MEVHPLRRAPARFGAVREDVLVEDDDVFEVIVQHPRGERTRDAATDDDSRPSERRPHGCPARTPPSTTRCVPVMNDASSLNRKRTARATSSG